MKKNILVMITLILANSASAGWVDSDWTEPMVGCAGGALVGYTIAKPGAQMQNAILFCSFGTIGALALNNYYESKIGKQQAEDITLLKKQLKAHQIRQATDAALGIDSNLSINRNVIPGSKRADGTVTAPTIQYELEQAGSGMILGD